MKKLIQVLLLASFIVFATAGCEDEESKDVVVCGIQDPLENIDWLKTLVSELTNDTEVDSATITSYDYLESNVLYVYVNKAPNKPIEPVMGEFLKLVLSKQGQEAVVKDGYVPVPAALAAKELAKLK